MRPPTAEAFSAQVVQLSPAVRMEVAERLLDCLDQPDAALEALWAEEANDNALASERTGLVWLSMRPHLNIRNSYIDSCLRLSLKR